MRAAPAENIYIESVCFGEKQIWFVGHKSKALEKADADAAVGDDLRQRQRGSLDVVAALDDLEVRGDGSEVLVCGLVCQVTKA